LNIKELRQEFISDLSGIYPSEEVLSFFNLLVEKHIGLSRINVALQPEKAISVINTQNFEDAIQRLKQFEPIQYIIGETEFYGLTFKVDSNVLIPRPETEELVNWIIDDVEENRKEPFDKFRDHKKEEKIASKKLPPISILDMGSGSGCIPIALAHHIPDAEITGVDISKAALLLANQNAILNNVNVKFIELDILNIEQKKWNLDPKLRDENSKFDCIVSNPPYVQEQEKDQIAPNVIDHEPAIALFVKDDDPLIFYRAIAQFAKNYLKSEGTLYFEINQYLYKDLVNLLKTEGFNEITLRKDIFGKERMIKCRKDD